MKPCAASPDGWSIRPSTKSTSTVQPGETVAAARERCYPALLRLRAARYTELAHVNLPWQAHSRRGAGIGLLLRA